MQEDPEFKPVESVVKPDLELIQDTTPIIFKCVSCGLEVMPDPTNPDLAEGAEDRLEVAEGLATMDHACPARPHPDLDDAPVDLPLEPEPFEHKEVGTPIRYILTNEAADAIFTDPNIVGLSPFFDSQEGAEATGRPYRARVWRLEEV